MAPLALTPSDSIAFGLPPSLFGPRHQHIPNALAAFLSNRIQRQVVTVQALSYDDLSLQVSHGSVVAAWLPPALFVELDRSVGLDGLAAAERSGGVGYFAAYFTHTDSDITSLRALLGRSVGWVDPSSASGYVFPRLQLAALGIDPTQTFQEEVFFRSHEAVARAVADRAVDVGATFVHMDPRVPHKIIRSGWSLNPHDVDPQSLRSLDPFGPLPADVIASTRDLPAQIADALGQSFLDIHKIPEVRQIASRQFGTGRFMPINLGAYDVLRRAMDRAEGNGVEVVASLRPSRLV